MLVAVTAVQAVKRHALAAHGSQKAWLDATQGMDSYLDAGDKAARNVSAMSGRFEYAEGWLRHLHLGLSAEDDDPLVEAIPTRVTTKPSQAMT